MSDRYDKAVKYLTEHPEQIGAAWVAPGDHRAGCLFQFVTKDGMAAYDDSCTHTCGCLTMVKEGRSSACPSLTKAIQEDPRLPTKPDEITVEHLPVFAEWQARIDRELRHKDEILR